MRGMYFLLVDRSLFGVVGAAYRQGIYTLPNNSSIGDMRPCISLVGAHLYGQRACVKKRCVAGV